MPSGRTHLWIESALLLSWAGAAGFSGLVGACSLRQVVLFIIAYVFSMLLLSPDLDLSESHAVQRWGTLRWLWKPYALAFRHRRLSHHLLWGPITRVIYLALWVIGAGLLLHRAFAGGGLPALRPSSVDVLPVGLGLFLPNAEHVLVDRLWSSWRRRRRNKRL